MDGMTTDAPEASSPQSPRPIVMMGVSGAGKTVVGTALAASLGRPFVDGDDLHPAANKEKMRAGIPLTDEDREPWLRIVGRRLAAGDGVVLACSALKRGYRDLLREYAPGAFFVHLDPRREVLQEHLAARSHEYMPPSLLNSQLDALEPLRPEERGAVFPAAESVHATAAAIRRTVEAAER